MVCVRVVVGCFTAVVAYNPGSMLVQQLFFDELATVLDRFATHQKPFYVVGDFNVRLDRPDDPHADQFRLLLDCYGLKLHATGPTPHLGSTLDAVITQETPGCPNCVAIEDDGLSDRHLLRWEVSSRLEVRRPSLLSVLVRGAIWIWSLLDPLFLLSGYVIDTTGQPTSTRWRRCTTPSSSAYLID